MVGVRQATSGSWLDPVAAGLLGWQLAQRLLRRCWGHKGVSITLTYRRDEWADQRELWHLSGEDEHVKRFMRRLGKRLGMNLAGKWLCKAEFQDRGWLHFHIVLLDVERIDHALLTECWGHGYTWIQRMTRSDELAVTRRHGGVGGRSSSSEWPSERN